MCLPQCSSPKPCCPFVMWTFNFSLSTSIPLIFFQKLPFCLLCLVYRFILKTENLKNAFMTAAHMNDSLTGHEGGQEVSFPPNVGPFAPTIWCQGFCWEVWATLTIRLAPVAASGHTRVPSAVSLLTRPFCVIQETRFLTSGKFIYSCHYFSLVLSSGAPVNQVLNLVDGFGIFFFPMISLYHFFPPFWDSFMI